MTILPNFFRTFVHFTDPNKNEVKTESLLRHNSLKFFRLTLLEPLKRNSGLLGNAIQTYTKNEKSEYWLKSPKYRFLCCLKVFSGP